LLDHVYRLKLVDKLPHIPRHQDGENKIIREVDDIISILTVLDEKKVLSSLPRYVAEDMDNMPAIRLYDTDLKLLSIWLEKAENKMDGFNASLNAIMTQIQVIQAKLGAQPTCNQPHQHFSQRIKHRYITVSLLHTVLQLNYLLQQ
jgi:hypothetical protein